MKSYLNFKRRFLLFAVLVSIFTSCDDQKIEPSNSVGVRQAENAIIPHNFNWEDPNMDWMPYPAGQPKITVPWVGAGSLFGVVPDDVLNDRKKSDGWNLVYNTFDPVIWNKNPYFILYNKYRGLLRVFLYINDMQFAESSYLQDGLYHGNSSLRMLNFAEKEIVDPTINVTSVDRVQPKPYNGAPLANNKWYFLQYEISYDPAIAPTTSPNPPQFSFYANSINVQQISLGGTLQANVNGTIGGSQGSSGQNFWNAVSPGLKTLGTAGLSAVGVGAVSKYSTGTEGQNTLGVNPAVWKGVKAGLDAALKGATGNLPGAAVNVLSSIIGGSSSGSQTVSLTLNGTLKLDGSQTGKGSLPSTPVSMYIPGTVAQNSSGGYNVQGYVPLYNKPLGVFNVTGKPTVKIHQIRSAPNAMGAYNFTTDYSIQPGTFNIQFNPIVNGGDATIVSVIPKVIAVFPDNTIETGVVYMTGSRETIRGQKAFTGTTFKSIHSNRFAVPPASEIYVRVAFVVRPKDGSPDAVIIKTFQANVERTFQFY